MKAKRHETEQAARDHAVQESREGEAVYVIKSLYEDDDPAPVGAYVTSNDGFLRDWETLIAVYADGKQKKREGGAR